MYMTRLRIAPQTISVLQKIAQETKEAKYKLLVVDDENKWVVQVMWWAQTDIQTNTLALEDY